MKKGKEIWKQIPWFPVILILIAGLGCSIWIQHNKRASRELTATEPTEAIIHTLTFLDGQGAVLTELTCEDHGFVLPPVQSSEGNAIVFRGWNQPLYDVRRSTELIPRYQDLSAEKNVFYIDSCYTQPGESVERTLWLAGQVAICESEITLLYDPATLKDFRCDPSDESVRILSHESGKLVLQLQSSENLTTAQSLASIGFTVDPARTDLAKTEIHITARDPKVWEAAASIGTDSVAISCDIYTLS